MSTYYTKAIAALTLSGAMLALPTTVSAMLSTPGAAPQIMSTEAIQARKAYQARRADDIFKYKTSLERDENSLLAVVAALKASCTGSCVSAL